MRDEGVEILTQLVNLWDKHDTEHDRMIHAATPEELELLLRGHAAGHVVERNPGSWWALTPKILEKIEGDE